MSYEKTVAEQAFSDLLHGPVPQTGIDFRRAIVMAVLVGRQLESEFTARIPTDPTWQTSPPTEPGVWEMVCAETDFEIERVTLEREDGVLLAVGTAIGTLPVDLYHGGLTETRWRFIAQP